MNASLLSLVRHQPLLLVLCWIFVTPLATEASESEESPATASQQQESDSAEASSEAAPTASTSSSESTSTDGTTSQQDEPVELRFSFDGVAWREVINWLAEEAELALHVGDVPTGSFTYSDPQSFTPDEAIARVNLFLAPQGFALVRSDRLLSVINLSDPRSARQLDAIAPLVKPDELDQQNSHDVVKTIFPLGEINAEDAVQELSVLNLMTTPEVLSRTNQIIAVDTASKLRNVKSILESFQSDQLADGMVVESFELEHVDAEDVLAVARPHLGLATGEMIGIDVSLSADFQGQHIFVTGVEDKVKMLENLVKAIDQPDRKLVENEGSAVLQTYSVEGGNVDMVYDVLQTLLAGRSVRLSKDEAAGNIVALATPSIQEEISQTVQQMKVSEADFEVIPLQTADPYQVVSLLEELLDLPSPLDDPDDIDPDAPRIDADPTRGRLFVRGRRTQIEQIKKIVEGLDGQQSGLTEDENIRMVPLKGRQAEQALDTAAEFWREENPIMLHRSPAAGEMKPNERVIGEENSAGETPRRIPVHTRISTSAETRWITADNRSDEPVIRCQLTPQGLLMQSDDTEALDRLESHLRMIADPQEATLSPPVVFYLKHTRANDAIRMLADLLQGSASSSESGDGSLINGYVPPSDSFYGTYVTSGDGTITMTAGDVTVVADSRLNRLIAQGTETEIDQIEDFLEIVDKEKSLTSIETYGSSEVIELVNTQASEVAEALRKAFAGRVEEENEQREQPGRGGNNNRRPDDGRDRDRRRNDDDRNGRNDRGGAGGQPVDLEPKMTIAVHEASNSLIVTAPEALLEKARQLAMRIDARGEQAVEVVVPSNGAVFEAVLQQVMLGESNSTRRDSDRRDRDDRRR